MHSAQIHFNPLLLRRDYAREIKRMKIERVIVICMANITPQHGTNNTKADKQDVTDATTFLSNVLAIVSVERNFG